MKRFLSTLSIGLFVAGIAVAAYVMFMLFKIITPFGQPDFLSQYMSLMVIAVTGGGILCIFWIPAHILGNLKK